MGLTFKENCPDLRNTRVIELKQNEYDGIVIAVAHNQFKALGAEGIRALGKKEHVLYDLKYILSSQEADLRL